MSFSDWSVVAEIVSAVGVIISLIYLAFQVHRNTRQLQFQGIEAARKEFLHNLDSNTRTEADASIFRRGLNAFGGLSPNEQACFHSQMHTLLHGFHSVWNLQKAGLLPTADFVPMRAFLVSLLTTQGGRQWWESFRHAPPPHLISHLERFMNDPDSGIAPATETLPWLGEDRFVDSGRG